MQIIVAIATTGRPHVLLETLRELSAQTRAPDAVFLCPAHEGDVLYDEVARLALPIRYSRGAKGASAQRNAILRDIPAADIVMFMDDDFLMADDYLAELDALFCGRPDVVIATGALVADDINGCGLSHAHARHLLAAASTPAQPLVTDIFNGYGCNMAVRWSRLADHRIFFDERLPLYSWAEDVDFSRQAAPFGRIVKSNRLRGVHRGVKSGRTAGKRFGYSQVANQLYLVRKGSVPARKAFLYGVSNILANMCRVIRPEPYIDRRGRLIGNWYALVDILRGRSSPERILDL